MSKNAEIAREKKVNYNANYGPVSFCTRFMYTMLRTVCTFSRIKFQINRNYHNENSCTEKLDCKPQLEIQNRRRLSHIVASISNICFCFGGETFPHSQSLSTCGVVNQTKGELSAHNSCQIFTINKEKIVSKRLRKNKCIGALVKNPLFTFSLSINDVKMRLFSLYNVRSNKITSEIFGHFLCASGFPWCKRSP